MTKTLTAKQADKITESKGANKGEKHVVLAADGRSLMFPTARWTGTLRELAQKGGSFKALEAEWAKVSTAKMAKGVDSRNSPHVAKSVADAKAKADKAAPKKTTAKAKADKAKKTTAKADPAADRTYTHAVKLADITLREGTWTEYMVQTALAHKSTAKADAALAAKPFDAKARKLDWKWLSDVRGYIAFA